MYVSVGSLNYLSVQFVWDLPNLRSQRRGKDLTQEPQRGLKCEFKRLTMILLSKETCRVSIKQLLCCCCFLLYQKNKVFENNYIRIELFNKTRLSMCKSLWTRRFFHRFYLLVVIVREWEITYTQYWKLLRRDFNWLNNVDSSFSWWGIVIHVQKGSESPLIKGTNSFGQLNEWIKSSNNCIT